MIETSKFARVPFYVDAVKVTDENIADVAKWCMGTVETEEGGSRKFIKVRVYRPLTERQTKAFVDDWVLYAGTGYKVYTDSAFKKSFREDSSSDDTDYRDAGTGRYVTEEYADENPTTTVAEASIERDYVMSNPKSVAEQQAEFAARMEA